MMEIEYKNAKRAYEDYNLNKEYRLTENILEYIKTRIEENRKEIEKLIKLHKREFKYENIKEVVDKEIEEGIEYKKQINIQKREDSFVSAKYLVSIGIVGIECYDTIEVIKYMIRGIKTRNAVIISDVEYEETDEKHLILEIIKEGLRKFKVDREIVQIVPYEECDYEKCDKVIYTYSGKENKEKKYENKYYIYIEEKDFIKEAKTEYDEERKRGRKVELVGEDIDSAIEKINETENEGVVIYTKNKDMAYKFVNMVRSKNVFVNATLLNSELVEKSSNELLMNKKIMYELVK